MWLGSEAKALKSTAAPYRESESQKRSPTATPPTHPPTHPPTTTNNHQQPPTTTNNHQQPQPNIPPPQTQILLNANQTALSTLRYGDAKTIPADDVLLWRGMDSFTDHLVANASGGVDVRLNTGVVVVLFSAAAS